MVGAWLCASLDSRLLSLLRPVGSFNTKLSGVLGVQPLPAAEFHGFGTDDASDGSPAEKTIQNIETDVPPRGAPGDKAAIDFVPQRQARAAAKGFKFPPHVSVLEHLGSVGSRHPCFNRRRRSHPGELYGGSGRVQIPSGVKGRPLAEMRRVGERLPDSFRRVAQFSRENE